MDGCKREEMTGRRRLHDEDLHNLNASRHVMILVTTFGRGERLIAAQYFLCSLTQ
jgi:hypothetical protein